MPGPLEGLVVVDASWGMPGAVTTMVLADYGADVLKVERPGGGPDRDHLLRSIFERGKRSVELDLSDPAGVAALRRLVGPADVFVESGQPGDADAAGFGFAALHAVAPRLVYCSISGYGNDTPLSDRPGFDCLVAARLGLMAEMAAGGPRPLFLGHPSVSYGAAFLCLIGILSALRARELTGRGQHIDASLLDSTIAQSAMNWFWNEKELSYLAREGTDLGFGDRRIITDLFKCADGEFLMVHTGGEGGFKRTMDLLGLGDEVQTIAGLEMSVPLDDREYHLARQVVPQVFTTRPREEWIKLFHSVDLAALPVLRPGEVLRDEQVEHADVLVDLPDRHGRVLRQVGPVIKFERSPAAPPTPAPRVGEHNSVLAELPARRPAATGAATGGAASISHALEGLRILDFSGFFATAYGAKLLSDLGADVIKVETLGGDQMRPLPDPFEACQRGKRDIAIDLKSEDGRNVVADLVATADVVMHNLRPGKAEKLGIGYEDLRRIKPDLVYAYLPGFGSSGPKAHLKSFAPLVSGFTGLLYEGAGAGNEPIRRVMGNEDYNNGFLGAVAVLLALHHRARTGEGQYVESPQLHSSLFVTTEHCLDAETGDTVAGLTLDAAQRGCGPLYRIYDTSDGWLAIACVGEGAFSRLVDALELDELRSDESFATEGGRDANADRLIKLVQDRLSTMTSADAFAVLDGHRVPCETPLRDPYMPDFLWEEWAAETGRVFEQHHAELGWMREMGLVVRLSDTPGVEKGPGPLLGQHTCEILAELGYDDDRIAQLLQGTVIDAARKAKQ